MICPKCNSDSPRKLSILYKEGAYSETSDVSLSTEYGTLKTEGNNKLAEYCSPPKKATTISSLFFHVLVSLVLALIVGAFLDSFFWGILIFSALGYWCYKLLLNDIFYNKNTFLEQNKKWKNSWLCMKCDTKYEQNTDQN